MMRDVAQFSAGGKRSAPSQAEVFFASETPVNPFEKSAAMNFTNGIKQRPARGGERRRAENRRAKSRIWPM